MTMPHSLVLAGLIFTGAVWGKHWHEDPDDRKWHWQHDLDDEGAITITAKTAILNCTTCVWSSRITPSATQHRLSDRKGFTATPSCGAAGKLAWSFFRVR